MILAAEKLLLIVVARSPGQYGSDVQLLTLNLTDHVLRSNAFGGILVMRTAGGVHVMVAGIPVVLRRIDPSQHRERHLVRARRAYCDLFRLSLILWTHRTDYCICTLRQEQCFAAGPIDLGLEKEVRCETLRGIWIEAPQGIANREGRHRGRTILVVNPKL